MRSWSPWFAERVSETHRYERAATRALERVTKRVGIERAIEAARLANAHLFQDPPPPPQPEPGFLARMMGRV